MKTVSNILHRLPRSPRLVAALASVSMTAICAAGVDFELVLWHGYDFYYGDAALNASGADAPATYHRVESPTGKIWQNRGNNNAGSPSTLSLTNDLAVLINEVTNGMWSLTLNVGDASEQQYAFSIDLAGVDVALFGDAVVTAPGYGAIVAANPPLIEWTGPSHLPTLTVDISLDDFPYTYQDGASLPGTSTNWTPTMVLPAGDQSIFLNYRTNNYAGATIGTPTNLVGGASLPGWSANVDVSTYAYSTFTVPGGGAEFDAAVESPGLSWITGGDANWFVQSNEYNVGVSALQSGAVGDYGTSWIETTVQGPGTLVFDWNMLADYEDYFSLTVSNLYGEYEETYYYGYEAGSWDYYEVALEEGENVLRWTFHNDDDAGGDYDAAFLDNVVVDVASDYDYEAEFSIEIERVDQGGSSYYLIFPRLPYSHPDPATVNEVESPNGLCSGDGTSSTSPHFATLQDAIDEIEAGTWTIYFDRYGSGHEFYFTISVNALTTNDLPVVTIADPVDGATGVSTNADFAWSGPAGFDSVHALLQHANPVYFIDFASLPASATTWTNAPALPEGTNAVTVSYIRQNFTGLTIGDPEDASFDSLYWWSESASLSTSGRSTFQTAAGFVPAPVDLLPPLLSGGDLLLSFVSQPGATHSVYYTTNLVAGSWMGATNFPGNGTTNVVTLPATHAAAFFKVETQ